MSKVSVLSSLAVKGPLIVDINVTEYPEDPQLGTFIVKDGALVVFTTVDGLETWYPLTRPNNTYVHSQPIGALEWIVSHGLTSGDVWYQVQDADGNPVSAAGFEKVDNNEFKLTFSEAQAGKVLVVATSGLDVPVVRTSLMQIGDADGVVLSEQGITVGGANGVAIGPDGVTLNGVSIGGFDDSAIQTALTGLTNADVALDGRLDVIEPLVAGHTTTIGQHTTTLGSHTTTIGDHTTAIAGLVAADTALDGRLDTLEAANAGQPLDLVNKGTATAASTVTFAQGGKASTFQKVQNGGAFTIALASFPANGKLGEMLIELVNGGAFAITWPAIRWIKADGSYTTTFSANEVTLQTSGSDFIMLWSSDGGTTVYGKVVR